MDHNDIQALIDKRRDEREPLAKIEQVDETTLSVNGHVYALEENVQDAFDFGQFCKTFNPFLSNFDFIVGDWGYGQLRLKGFYLDAKPVAKSLKHQSIPDYLVEDVNFGSSYFVLHNLDAEHESPLPQTNHREKPQSNSRGQSKSKTSHPRNKQQSKRKNRKPRVNEKTTNVRQKQKRNKKSFVIKQK